MYPSAQISLITFIAVSVQHMTVAHKKQLMPLTTNTEYNSTKLYQLLQNIDYITVHLRQWQDTDNGVVRLLLQNNICPLQLKIDVRVPHFAYAQRHRAFFTSSAHLEFVLNNYAVRQGIMICILWDQPNKEKLLHLSRHLWTTRSVFQVYYVIQNISDRYLDIVFFNPFARRGQLFGELVNINEMSYLDIFHNLNGYPLRTYIFNSVYTTVHGDKKSANITSIQGSEVEVAKLLSQKLNFSMKLQWPDNDYFGARLKNGSYNGAIGRLIRLEADITLTGFFVKDYLTRDIDFSVSVYTDDLCCFVLKAKRVPQSILPLFAVHVDVWIAFIFVGLLCPFIWMSLRCINLYAVREPSESKRNNLQLATRHHLSANIKNQFLRIYIDTWIVWVRVNVVHFPPFFSERIFVLSLCLVSVIFGALFESSLQTVYIHPLYYKDINTMEELNDANIRIHVKHAAIMDDLFSGHSSLVYQSLNRKLLLVAKLEERLINIVSERGGFAAVTRSSSMQLDDIRYYISNKIHKIPECPRSYHIAFVFPSQSPFEKPINVLLLRFIEAGLIGHWIDETRHQSKIHLYSFPEFVSESGYKWKVLTLGDLQIAFYALFSGSCLAMLSLFIELILKYKTSYWRFSRKVLKHMLTK